MQEISTPLDYVMDALKMVFGWSIESIRTGNMSVFLSILVLLTNILFYNNLGLGLFIFLHGLFLGVAISLRLSSKSLNVLLGSLLILVINTFDLYLSVNVLVIVIDWITIFTVILDLLAVTFMIIWLSIFRTK